MDVYTILFVLMYTIIPAQLFDLLGLPILTHVDNFALVVKIGIVVLPSASPSLPDREMVGMDSNAMVLAVAACPEIRPSSFLLRKVQTGGVWKEKPIKKHTSQAKPRNDPELHLRVDIVVQNSGKEGSKLSDSC